jgi:hypothetical protein
MAHPEEPKKIAWPVNLFAESAEKRIAAVGGYSHSERSEESHALSMQV